MIMYILNKHYKNIKCPLQAFRYFLQYYSVFEWDKYCLTLHGQQLLSMYPYWDAESTDETRTESTDTSTSDSYTNSYLIGPRLMDELRKCYQYQMECSNRPFQIRSVNILDPLVS